MTERQARFQALYEAERARICWASGSEAVPITVGGARDGGSSMLLGTTDGGSTWSKVTFSVPAGAPNAYGQSYLSIGSISCPATNACVALGLAAQSSPTTPFTASSRQPRRFRRRWGAAGGPVGCWQRVLVPSDVAVRSTRRRGLRRAILYRRGTIARVVECSGVSKDACFWCRASASATG
jgi:hypothetical protein